MAETTPTPDYPPAPWHMHGSLWLSLFWVRGASPRPDGIYGAAMVRYLEPSPLTYWELLVARTVKTDSGTRVTITDIWVDSPASMAGGRALWAIPKGLADFASDNRSSGPLGKVSVRAFDGHGAIASARFRDLSALAPRLPFSGGTWHRRDNGDAATADLTGSARSAPAIARWEFASGGPLAFLRGQRQLASFRMADFKMVFG